MAWSTSQHAVVLFKAAVALGVAVLGDPAQMLDYYYSYGKSQSITVWQNLKGLGLCLNGKWAWTGLQVILASWWFDTVSCKDCISTWF